MQDSIVEDYRSISKHVIKPASKSSPSRIRWIKRSLTAACGLAILYGVVAYTILPALWRHYDR